MWRSVPETDPNAEQAPEKQFKPANKVWKTHIRSMQWPDNKDRRDRCLYTQRQGWEWDTGETRDGKQAQRWEMWQDTGNKGKTSRTKIKQEIQTGKSQPWNRKCCMNLWQQELHKQGATQPLSSYIIPPAIWLTPTTHNFTQIYSTCRPC